MWPACHDLIFNHCHFIDVLKPRVHFSTCALHPVHGSRFGTWRLRLLRLLSLHVRNHAFESHQSLACASTRRVRSGVHGDKRDELVLCAHCRGPARSTLHGGHAVFESLEPRVVHARLRASRPGLAAAPVARIRRLAASPVNRARARRARDSRKRAQPFVIAHRRTCA